MSNPYAPPESDFISPITPGNAPMKRPKSTKWAITVFLFSVAFFVVLNGLFIYRGGGAIFLDSFWQSPWDLLPVLTHLSALLSFILFDRKPVAYWAGVVALGTMCIGDILVMRDQWSATWRNEDDSSASMDLGPQISDIIGALFIFGLMLYLFYRFTFGRPSRVYFRVAGDLR